MLQLQNILNDSAFNQLELTTGENDNDLNVFSI